MPHFFAGCKPKICLKTRKTPLSHTLYCPARVPQNAPKNTTQRLIFFAPRASEKFQKKLINICDENQYQKTVDLSVGKNSKNGKNSTVRDLQRLHEVASLTHQPPQDTSY
jgi:hypothetical protein